MKSHPVLLAPLAALIGVLTLAACGSDATTADTTSARTSKVEVEASFYPLQWMVEQIGGGHVDVENLTKPGAEPHDLELTPSDVAAVADADLVVYLSGFQPAVDDAVANSEATVFDAADAADLDLTFTPIEEGEQHDDEAGAVDPHFWLDPSRLTAVAKAFTETLGDQDPGNRETYQQNLAALTAKLDELDQDFTDGLADCANQDLVTSHNAFGYLARRYGLNQVGITGLTPEAEPSAGQLAAVTDFVDAHDVQTIYFETLVSPAIAKTVASETGAKTAVLDPLEGLNDDSEGNDYLEVMRANLANIEAGQPCR
jgi:zinc transport system substrate-binding protein